MNTIKSSTITTTNTDSSSTPYSHSMRSSKYNFRPTPREPSSYVKEHYILNDEDFLKQRKTKKITNQQNQDDKVDDDDYDDEIYCILNDDDDQKSNVFSRKRRRRRYRRRRKDFKNSQSEEPSGCNKRKKKRNVFNPILDIKLLKKITDKFFWVHPQDKMNGHSFSSQNNAILQIKIEDDDEEKQAVQKESDVITKNKPKEPTFGRNGPHTPQCKVTLPTCNKNWSLADLASSDKDEKPVNIVSKDWKNISLTTTASKQRHYNHYHFKKTMDLGMNTNYQHEQTRYIEQKHQVKKEMTFDISDELLDDDYINDFSYHHDENQDLCPHHLLDHDYCYSIFKKLSKLQNKSSENHESDKLSSSSITNHQLKLRRKVRLAGKQTRRSLNLTIYSSKDNDSTTMINKSSFTDSSAANVSARTVKEPLLDLSFLSLPLSDFSSQCPSQSSSSSSRENNDIQLPLLQQNTA